MLFSYSIVGFSSYLESCITFCIFHCSLSLQSRQTLVSTSFRISPIHAHYPNIAKCLLSLFIPPVSHQMLAVILGLCFAHKYRALQSLVNFLPNCLCSSVYAMLPQKLECLSFPTEHHFSLPCILS